METRRLCCSRRLTSTPSGPGARSTATASGGRASTTPTRGRKSTPTGGTAATVGRYTPPAWDSRPRSRRARPRIQRRAETDADRTEIASLRPAEVRAGAGATTTAGGETPPTHRRPPGPRRRHRVERCTLAATPPPRRGTRPTRPGEIACGHRPRPPAGRAITPGPASRNPRRATRPPPGQLRPTRDAHRRRRSPSRPAQEVNRDHHHQRTSRRGHRRGPSRRRKQR